VWPPTAYPNANEDKPGNNDKLKRLPRQPAYIRILFPNRLTRMASIFFPTYLPAHAKRVLDRRFNRLPKGASIMLDLVFIATGGIFLLVCALYAYACDHL
jgi:hypothetical protein